MFLVSANSSPRAARTAPVDRYCRVWEGSYDVTVCLLWLCAGIGVEIVSILVVIS